MQEIKILDHGYVRLLDHMGNDEAIANAARISYDKGTKRISDDRSLIRYLMRHRHTSPFEMVEFQFELKLPLFIIQHVLRHRTANINQMSLRYSEATDEFYIPELDRIQPQSSTNKQGSAGKLSDNEANFAQNIIRDISANCTDSYKLLLNDYSVSKFESDVFFTGEESERQGVSRELSRMVLPANLYSKLVWKIDLHNLFNFLRLRMGEGAQQETQELAKAVFALIQPIVPIAIEAFEDFINKQLTFSRMEAKLLLDLTSSSMWPAQAALFALVQKHGSEDDAAKHYELSKREWSEFKKKLNLT